MTEETKHTGEGRVGGGGGGGGQGEGMTRRMVPQSLSSDDAPYCRSTVVHLFQFVRGKGTTGYPHT